MADRPHHDALGLRPADPLDGHLDLLAAADRVEQHAFDHLPDHARAIGLAGRRRGPQRRTGTSAGAAPAATSARCTSMNPDHPSSCANAADILRACLAEIDADRPA
jgi:hypothetical protein